MPSKTPLQLPSVSASDSSFSLFFEFNPVPIWIFDAENLRFLNVNKAAVKKYGHSKNDFLKMSLKDILCPEEIAPFENHLKKLKHSPLAPLEYVSKHRIKSGQIVVAKVTRCLITYKGVCSVLAFAVDITAEIRAQDELSSTQERFLAFMNNNPATTWIKDENFKYVYINSTYEQLFNVTLKKCRGKDDFELWPEAVAKEFRNNDQAVLSSRKPLRTEEMSPDAQGVQHQWLVYKFPFQDSKGRLLVGGIGFDITQLRKVTQEVKFQDSLLEKVRNAVVVTDREGIVRYWNRFAETLYQWTSEEALGRPLFQLIIPEESKLLASGIMAQMQTQGHWEGEFLVRRKDGKTFPAFVADTVLRDEQGNVTGFAGISVDMGDFKATQKALEEKNIALKEILAQLEIDKKVIKDQFSENVDKLVMPVLKKIKNCASEPGSVQKYIEILETQLEDLTSTGSSRLASKFKSLTGKEFEICNLIRNGLSSKEIAKLLAISHLTVETHRVSIRKKLRIPTGKINLASYLKAQA